MNSFSIASTLSTELRALDEDNAVCGSTVMPQMGSVVCSSVFISFPVLITAAELVVNQRLDNWASFDGSFARAILDKC